ncbi:MAG TPA: Uma2 family endonuclease [Pyrinomonadaceae bacterium]|nr:Uma2 family endonuclease [Pyrinomonadaceae bacterium]
MSATTHLMTAEELFSLDDGSNLHELVKGELLTMSPPGAKHGAVGMNISAPLHTYVSTKKLGIVFLAETGFILERNPDTVLAPDCSFIRSERLSNLPDGYLEIAPDLVVEITSPSQSRPKMEIRASQWLEYGVLEVWLVDPKTRTINVRRVTGKDEVLREGDDLIGGNIVPGFRIPLSKIFL